MLILRKIFFYLFFVIYLVACPILVLYAFGFILKPSVVKPVLKTGLVYFSTTPPGAAILLKDQPKQIATPSAVEGIQPGDYSARLILDGYKPWVHDFTVEANKATVFDNILLIPNEWKKETLIDGPCLNLYPIPLRGFFLIKKGDALIDHFIYNMKDEKVVPMLEEDSRLKEAKVLNVYRVRKNLFLLVHILHENKKRYLWAQLGADPVPLEDITELFSEVPEHVFWAPNDQYRIFAYQDGYVNLLDIQSKAVYPKYADHINGFGVFNKKAYVLTNEYELYRMDYDKSGKEVLLDDKNLGRSLFEGKGFIHILPFADDIIAFLTPDGELITNHLPYRFADSGVLDAEFYVKDRRLLLRQKDRVGTVSFLTEVIQGVAFEKGPELTWISIKGKNIEQAFWAFEGSHIIFRDRAEVSILELEEAGRPHQDYITRVKNGTSVAYSDDSGRLYFLEEGTGELSCIQVIPGGQNETTKRHKKEAQPAAEDDEE